MDDAMIGRREALKRFGFSLSTLFTLGLFPAQPLSLIPNREKYPVQFIAVGEEATLSWLKIIVENHHHYFRTISVHQYELGWEHSWVNCHIKVSRKGDHGLPAYPKTWENAVCERLDAIKPELQKGERNVVMAALGDYFADGVSSVIATGSLIQCNIPTLAFVTLPHPFRGTRRTNYATQALKKMRRQRQIMPVIVVSRERVRQALSSLVERFAALPT